MTIFFIAAAFVAAALAVFLIAMRSGPRKGTQPAGDNALFNLAMVGATVVALGVSFWVMNDNAEVQSTDAISGIELTKGEVEGRELFGKNCATCHVLADAGASGRVGPSFDQLRPAKGLVVNAIELGRNRGQSNMPAGLLGGKDAENVGAYIAAVAGR